MPNTPKIPALKSPVRVSRYIGLLLIALTAFAACDGNEAAQSNATAGQTVPEGGVTDISNRALSSLNPDCAAYRNRYVSRASDASTGQTYQGELTITLSPSSCIFASNSIPNHSLDGRRFANPLRPVSKTFQVPRNPSIAASPTALSLAYDNAIMLNGVKLDLLAAACYGVGRGQALGRERIGCNRSDRPWRYDPMHPGNNFGTDRHNAHTQPDGAYHYHGDPKALYLSGVPSPVIGFAADGFPIYGPYISDAAGLRRVRSGYRLKSGPRQPQAGEGAFPGGRYDGTFVDDWEFTGDGDLDRCNGMVYNGSYAYFVTDSYPWVMGCFAGTPDPSFRKRR